MRVFILGFVAGIAWLQTQAVLPGWPWLLAAGVLGVALLLPRTSALATRCLAAGVLLGVAWAGGWGQVRLADSLNPELEGRDIAISGVVASLPQELERGVRFEFDVEQAGQPIPVHISLAWYRGVDEDDASPRVPVRAGERWSFTARLKRPHGNLNPHGFDFEAWLFERGIRATGYVRPRSAQRIEAMVWHPGYAVERLRETLRDRFRAALPAERFPFAGILVALAIGDQRAIDPELWAIFARTGITHLMSISGLHVTMLAGLAHALTGWLWRRSPRLPLRVPAQQAAAVGGFLAAWAYCLLAGFAVPAQRTLYMLGVVALAWCSRREMAASRVLALALLVVLLRDPWAVLAAGFWLSFGAVALLFYIGSGRQRRPHWLREWAQAQWAVTVGMLPALLALFQQFSLVSPLANALAIPVVSFVVTPLALLGALPGLGFCLDLGHAATGVLMVCMEWLAARPWAVWQQAAAPGWAVALALAGGVWLLLPRGFPARWLGAAMFLPLLTVAAPRPPVDAARVAVLDVGQGLAVHVQTATHDLLFDAGPAYSADADSGNRLIVPYLRALGVGRLDTFVVSHADRDHEGGAASVLAAVPVTRLLSSLPFEHALSAQPVPQHRCRAGEAWEWDGVRVLVLHPAAGPEARRTHATNAESCVLRIEAGGRALLLTSDIEAAEESALAARQPALLRAEVVLVPHHGSRTSSSPEFVAATGATEAVIPVGYRSRFGHPRPEVVARWQAAGAAIHRTDRDGAVTVDLSAAGVAVRHERADRRRYWHDG